MRGGGGGARMEEFETSSSDDSFIKNYRAAKRAKREAVMKKASGAHNKEKGSLSLRSVVAGMTAVAYVAVEDTDTLDCGVCYLPLKPPIFQCDEGHAVCSSCRDKLAPAGKCHVCGIATPRYHRCRAMESLVESIRVPCPNAAYGCDARPAYYDERGHNEVCPHAPLRCPGKDCGFLGSTMALLDHFTGTHGWPSATKIIASRLFNVVRLYDGFNFVLASVTDTSRQHLLLLNVTRRPVGRAITVHLISRKQPSERLTCLLSYTRHLYDNDDPRERRKCLGSHNVQTKTNVEYTADLSNGLPSPDDCIQFIVPDFILGDENKEDIIQIQARISITDE